MIGESKIIDAEAGASGSASFNSHNSDRILIRVVPTTTCNVTISGTATSLESDAGTTLDSSTGVTSAGFLVNLENTPCYKVTVAWDTLSGGGAVSAYAWVGGV
tara:strand:- start:445 stop:753 length:309 start_codon:yes stop_codon:yes gene_type:complete